MDPTTLVAQMTGLATRGAVPTVPVKFSVGYFIVMLVFYVFVAYCLMVIAKKTNTPNSWMAWIPILNAYLMCKAAGKPGWWLILFLIPIVNLIVLILVGIGLAQALKKPVWAGVLLIIPVVNLFCWAYLAFAKAGGAVTPGPTPTTEVK